MHAADLAHVLEALPLSTAGRSGTSAARLGGNVFVEVSAAVRDSLVAVTSREDLIALLSTLDPEDLGYVSESLPGEVVDELSEALESSDRTVFEDSIQHGGQSDAIWVASSLSSQTRIHWRKALIDLRQRGELPPQTDRVRHRREASSAAPFRCRCSASRPVEFGHQRDERRHNQLRSS